MTYTRIPMSFLDKFCRFQEYKNFLIDAHNSESTSTYVYISDDIRIQDKNRFSEYP